MNLDSDVVPGLPFSAKAQIQVGYLGPHSTCFLA